jgi:hypothetical protein
MAEQQKQQGKHHPAAPDAPTGDVAQTNAPVGDLTDAVDRELGLPVGTIHTSVVVTPAMRAKDFVRSALMYFDADEQSISKQVSQEVHASIQRCPPQDIVAFRTEGKLRAERLKQFGELLFNEFVYQTATLK